MSVTAIESDDIAEDEQRILGIILDNGGVATTTELEEGTDLNSGQIYYRLDKLESGGWIAVQEGSSSRDGPGRPPKEAVLTKRSVESIDLEEREGAIVVAGGASADVSVLREQLDEARDEIGAFEDTVEQLTGTLDALADAVDALDGGD